MSEPEIIYEDESLMVLEKPAGWIVNDATTTSNQPTIQSWLRRNFQYPISNDQLLRNGIVHRLDKETSGILLVAKTKETFERLQQEFKERRVEKTYTALVHGKVNPPIGGEGEIKASVGRLPWRRDRFGVLPGGREAITRYRVINNLQCTINNSKQEFTLLELYPKTGRTHQIRIHLKYLGHPIAGDEFYAGRKTARDDRKWCPRLFLHAGKIKVEHPLTGKILEFESKLPSDLNGALEKLGASQNKQIEQIYKN
jgi:23S rRNA pseudouridine1911/1915/1917 synthase